MYKCKYVFFKTGCNAELVLTECHKRVYSSIKNSVKIKKVFVFDQSVNVDFAYLSQVKTICVHTEFFVFIKNFC